MAPVTRDAYSEQLRSYLRTILRRTALLHFASGMVSFVALGAWVFLGVIVWAGAADEPGHASASVVSWLAMIALSVIFGYFVVWPLVRLPRLEQLAAEVEKRRDLKELVRAGFEFSNDPQVQQRYSPELVREVIRQAVERISGVQVRFLFLSRKDIALMPVAYGGLFVLLLVALFNPGAITRGGIAVASPESVAARDHSANIFARPGNVTVLAGSDVEVTGLDLGRSDTDVSIKYEISDDFWKAEPTERVAGSDELAEGELRFDRYRYTFYDMRHTVRYYFDAGEERSPTYTITVVHEPILTDMKITLTPPAYTGEPPLELVDNGGNVQALEGTQVVVEGRSNNPLAGAWVRFDDKDPAPVTFDRRDVRFDFVALEDGYYRVLLEDSLGFDTSEPLEYSVEVFQDNAPSIEVLEPGGDTMLPRNRLLDIGFIASDDYGVRSAAVYFRKSGASDFERLGVPLGKDRDAKDVAVAYRWNLADVQLFPGNYIEYFVMVADNNVVTGPGTAKSKTFRITVPTMAELYERVKEEDEKRADMMSQAIQDSEEFKERLEKIQREFLKTEKMEWTQKKEVDRALEKHKEVEEQLDAVQQSLEETLKELSENEMTSQEIGEKMEEIRDLLEEIDSEELREHMEELREAIEKLNPEEIKQALENLDVDAAEMLEKLERTAELLKQIAREQKMEEMVRKTRDLMDAQKDLAEQTSETDAGDQEKMGELSDEQQQLAEQTEGLEEQMQEFAEAMQQEDPQTSSKMSEMSQQMQKQGPQQNMKDASRELQQQNKQGAQQQQQQAMDKMISLFQQMQQAQQQMQMNQGQQMAADFQKYARQTLELSKRQEQLARDLQGQSRPVDDLADMQQVAQDQMSYLRATEKVADEIMKMAGQSLQVSPRLMETLGQAIDRMQNSVLFLEQNKPFMSTAHANNAVEALNEATIEMLRSARSCSQGTPSPGGQQSLAQQLMQQLIPQQQSILEQTQQMLEMQAMGEKLRQERQAQIERLAGQQRSLKDIAEEIQKSLNQEDDVLGRLDRTVEEMEAVVEALEGGKIDDDVVNREQRILSRLLDAQRSIHTRDYEKKRESVTAEEVFSKSLGGDGNEPMSQTLRDEIRRAMQLKAPGEFEDLIKLYFRALAEESTVHPPAQRSQP